MIDYLKNVEGKDNYILELEKRIKERDRALKDYAKNVEGKDNYICDLQMQIEERDEYIKELTGKIEENKSYVKQIEEELNYFSKSFSGKIRKIFKRK